MSLRPPPSPSIPPDSPFTYSNYYKSPSDDNDDLVKKEESTIDVTSLPSPPTSWLSAKDMKMFGATPLTASTDIGIVRCRDCDKPVLKSAITDHAENCKRIKLGPPNGKKNPKGKTDDGAGKGTKRKSADGIDDGSGPPNKKAKSAPKITKGRAKGPVDYDKQCGVINDKGLPCSRSLTCKSHSMGAKRSVLGRSRPYDELLLDWYRANKPNFVEPVKRETKAEKKEKRDREREEKRRLKELEGELKKGQKKTAKGGGGGGKKKGGAKDGKGGAASQNVNDGEDEAEAVEEDLDSEAEMESLVKAFRMSRQKGLIGVPLATADEMNAGTFCVARRERLRNLRDLLAGALSRRPLTTASGRAG